MSDHNVSGSQFLTYSSGDLQATLPNGAGASTYIVALPIGNAAAPSVTVYMSVNQDNTLLFGDDYVFLPGVTQPVNASKGGVSLTGNISATNYLGVNIYEFTGSLNVSGTEMITFDREIIGISS